MTPPHTIHTCLPLLADPLPLPSDRLAPFNSFEAWSFRYRLSLISPFHPSEYRVIGAFFPGEPRDSRSSSEITVASYPPFLSHLLHPPSPFSPAIPLTRDLLLLSFGRVRPFVRFKYQISFPPTYSFGPFLTFFAVSILSMVCFLLLPGKLPLRSRKLQCCLFSTCWAMAYLAGRRLAACHQAGSSTRSELHLFPPPLQSVPLVSPPLLPPSPVSLLSY